MNHTIKFTISSITKMQLNVVELTIGFAQKSKLTNIVFILLYHNIMVLLMK